MKYEKAPMRLLPPGFIFLETCVCVPCGKGTHKQFANYAGMKQFRLIISQNIDKYVAAESKSEKVRIIMSIVSQIRRNAPGGFGFIALDKPSGRWYEVGDALAREKVSHALKYLISVKSEKEQKLPPKKRRLAQLQPAEKKTTSESNKKKKCSHNKASETRKINNGQPSKQVKLISVEETQESPLTLKTALELKIEDENYHQNKGSVTNKMLCSLEAAIRNGKKSQRRLLDYDRDMGLRQRSQTVNHTVESRKELLRSLRQKSEWKKSFEPSNGSTFAAPLQPAWFQKSHKKTFFPLQNARTVSPPLSASSSEPEIINISTYKKPTIERLGSRSMVENEYINTLQKTNARFRQEQTKRMLLARRAAIVNALFATDAELVQKAYEIDTDSGMMSFTKPKQSSMMSNFGGGITECY